MRPRLLRIRAIGPYQDVTVDFDSIPGELVAICGRNGEGKSFLLDSIVAGLYRALPSRTAGIYRYCTDRNAGIDLDFALDGSTYQTTVLIDSKSRKMEAVLAKDRRPLCDGKTGPFDKEIEKLLGPLSQVLASSYGAQTKEGNFVSIEKSERKELFLRMIGGQLLQRISDRAKKRIEPLELQREKSTGRLQSLRETAGLEKPDTWSIHTAIENKNGDLMTLDSMRKELVEQIAQCRAKTADLPDLLQEYGSIELELKNKEEELIGVSALVAAGRANADKLDECRGSVNATTQMIQSTLERMSILTEKSAKLEPLKLQLNSLWSRKDKLTAEGQAIKKALAEQEALAANIEPLRAKAARLPELREQYGERIQEQTRLQGEFAALLQAERDYADLQLETQKKLATLEKEEMASSGCLERAQRDAVTIKSVPCRAVGEYAKCQFITSAVESAGRIDEFTAGIDNARALMLLERQTMDQVIKPDQAQKKRIYTRLDELRDQVPALLSSIRDVELATTKLPEAEGAATKAGMLRDQLKTAREAYELLQVDIGTVEAEIQEAEGYRNERTQLATAVANDTAALETAKQALKVAEEAAAKLPLLEERKSALSGTIGHGKLSRAKLADTIEAIKVQAAALRAHEGDLEVLDLQIDSNKKAQQDLHRQLAEAQSKVRSIEDAVKTLAEEEAKIEPLTRRIACLARISKSFGPMEIQSFEIDSAGPAVSAIANDLLFNCFGPRYSIKLVTQELKADNSGYKDEFDVSVYDQRQSRWVSIDDLSGGQKVIVSEALALAIALFNKQKNGIAWETLFRDEASSALDIENAPAYIRMLRRAREMGHFSRVYFISHQPFLEKMADSVLRVANGQVAVE